MGREVVGREDGIFEYESTVPAVLDGTFFFLPGKVALQLRQLDRAAHGQDAGRETPRTPSRRAGKWDI